MDIGIRVAREEDAKELLNIYAHYVANTAITFEHEVPTVAEFACRIKETLKQYPYLVALVDGKIVGYIYAGRFRTRASYAWSASTSVYIDKQYRRMGIGKMLYEKLESILVKQNIINVYAGIASPEEEDEYLTRSSEYFHQSIGYKLVARYHECGSKFGRWYNLIEMEKIIGERTCPPKEFVPFERLIGEEILPMDDQNIGDFDNEFWKEIDELVSGSEIIIDRPKGTAHPKYPNFIYRVDYGYLKNTTSMDGAGIDVWVGTGNKIIDAVMCTVDLMKKDSEIKILIGCTEEEKAIVYQTHNESPYMKGMLIRR